MSNSQPNIAILGLGTRSTLFYLEQLNTKFHAIKGEYHTFPSITYSVDFNTLNPYLPNQFDVLKPVVAKHLNRLTQYNISSCIIPNITLHETVDQLHTPVSIIHPITLCIRHLKSHNINKVTLFGSLYTMTSSYISDIFKKENISISFPNKQDQISIDNCRKQIYNYSETDADQSNYSYLISKYNKESCVVVACTELSIWSPKYDSKTVIDMALLQIEKALKNYI